MSLQPSCLLLGADENESLPVLSSLARRGVPVTAAAPRRLSMGLFSRYPRRRLICPDPDAHPDDFLGWVQAQVQTGEFPVTMVCGESATWLMARARDNLAPYTTIPVVNVDTFLVCRNKARTMKEAANMGVAIPRTWYPDDVGIDAVAGQVPDWPVVLKPAVSNGARGISYPRNPGELTEQYERTRAEYGECIVQEFIPHSAMQYKAELLLDGQSRAIAGGVYNKPRFYPPSGGSSTLNSTVERPDIMREAERFLQGIGWYGMGDCDFIVDPRDGNPKLMEVNPRFTRSIKILVEAGLDFPFMLYELALGRQPKPNFEYRKGLYLRYFLSDCVWFLRSPDRFRARPSFFWFFGRDLRGEIFSWSDPTPSVAYLLGNVLKLFSAEQRRFLLRPGGKSRSGQTSA